MQKPARRGDSVLVFTSLNDTDGHLGIVTYSHDGVVNAAVFDHDGSFMGGMANIVSRECANGRVPQWAWTTGAG